MASYSDDKLFVTPMIDKETGKIAYDFHETEEYVLQQLTDAASIALFTGDLAVLPLFSELGLAWGGAEAYVFEEDSTYMEE